MDEEGEISIPVTNGNHLKGEDIVGSHIQNYNSMLVLSHFKGHVLGGWWCSKKYFYWCCL